MRTRLLGPAAALFLAAAACGGDNTGPDTGNYTIAKHAGDGQYGEVGQLLAEPLAVRVTDGGDPVEGLRVTWKVVTGSGASVSPVSAATDSNGVTQAQLRLGSETGVYEVEVSFTGMTDPAPVFTATAIRRPVITSVSPSPAEAGDTVVLSGTDFHPTATENAVLFDGIRGTVLDGSATELRAIVPRCVPSRRANVTVRIGAVESAPAPLDVIGDEATPVDLAVGEVLSLSDPADLACVRLPGGQYGATFLAVPQNANPIAGRTLPFQLVGVIGQPVTLTSFPVSAPSYTLSAGAGRPGLPQLEWDARLRAQEQEISPSSVIRHAGPRFQTMAVPQPGDRKTFKVYNKDGEFTTVTAEVKYVSTQAVIYQDVKAPSSGFTAADFEAFGRLFDDPIFTVDTAAFGKPSDIDANGRIIILFTPVVNEMTPEGSDGFIAGFFYGLDLTDSENSNKAEIFYSIVPDPNGQYGDPRSRDDILTTVPPVLAHELQHMIHFNQRVIVGGAPSQEVLWLSEALAHMAEDLVGQELLARGETEEAMNFQLSNYVRAYRYLEAPTTVSVVDVEDPGTLEERGAQWLFLKYLAEHFGGVDFLRAVTRSTVSGAANIEQQTGEPWEVLFDRWAVALWADDAPELEGVPVDSIYTFPQFDMRAELGQFRGGFPLRPVEKSFSDFSIADTLPVSSALHLILKQTRIDTPPLHMSFSGPRGVDFAPEDRPRWSIMRIR